MTELKVPEAAAASGNSVELLRAWIVDGALHCVISPDVWDDPSAWGIMLADVARHVANARVEIDSTTDPGSVVASIAQLFNAEIDSPTDVPSGHLV